MSRKVDPATYFLQFAVGRQQDSILLFRAKTPVAESEKILNNHPLAERKTNSLGK